MKRILSAILAFSIIVCACTAADFFAFAKFNKQTVQTAATEITNPPDYNTASEQFNEFILKYKDVISLIEKGYSNLQESIRLYKFKITQKELKTIVMYLSMNHGFYYVNTAFSYTELGEYIYDYTPDYTMTAEEIEKSGAQIEAVVDKIAAEAADMKTDIEKLIYIHNYIVDNMIYDERGDYTQNNIYGALVLKKTMCIGYAEAFNSIASRLGFVSFIVTSEELEHAWNMIFFDGSFYFIDCTWDDPTITEPTLSSDLVSGYGCYQYFMCSEKMLLENEYNASDWLVNGCNVSGVANSTAYDDFFWHEYESLMRYSNGVWYHDYEYPEANVRNYRDVKFSIDKIEFTDNKNYTSSTERTISTYWDIGAGYYMSFESTLQNIHDSIYYMTANGIYRLEGNGRKNGKDDLLVFENDRSDNIYDFKIDTSAGTFTVLFGKTEEYSEENAVELTYKIADYFCRIQKHQYEKFLDAPTEKLNGKAVYTCNTCGDKLTEIIYCRREMEKLYKYAQNSSKDSSNYNASVDYNRDGVIDETDWNLIKNEYDAYSLV